MISIKAFTHKSNYMILLVFFLSIIALFFDVLEKNKLLENFMGILNTFVSTSSIFWFAVILGLFIYFIPLMFLIKVDENYKVYFFKYPIVPKLYKFLEKCSLIIVNSIHALVGSFLALAVLMLFSENPLVNSLTFIFIAGITYILAILQLSMSIDIKYRINLNRNYF